MSVTIKGIDKLINKLNKISNIATKEIIEDIATDVEGVIRNKAKTFADTSYMLSLIHISEPTRPY